MELIKRIEREHRTFGSISHGTLIEVLALVEWGKCFDDANHRSCPSKRIWRGRNSLRIAQFRIKLGPIDVSLVTVAMTTLSLLLVTAIRESVFCRFCEEPGEDRTPLTPIGKVRKSLRFGRGQGNGRPDELLRTGGPRPIQEVFGSIDNDDRPIKSAKEDARRCKNIRCGYDEESVPSSNSEEPTPVTARYRLSRWDHIEMFRIPVRNDRTQGKHRFFGCYLKAAIGR